MVLNILKSNKFRILGNSRLKFDINTFEAELIVHVTKIDVRLHWELHLYSVEYFI